MPWKMVHVSHGKGRLSFSLDDGETRSWWRQLRLDGNPIYLIGNVCDTCQAIFGQVSPATMPLAPQILSQSLRDGLQSLDPRVVDSVAAILPDGGYMAGLFVIHPAFFPDTRSRTPPDGTAVRQQTQLTQDMIIPEIFLPLITADQYNLDAVEQYKQMLMAHQLPTALALSGVDARYPSGKCYQWQLVHFLLDGHHKIRAAYEMGRPITLLSFLALDQSHAAEKEISAVVERRYKQETKLTQRWENNALP